MSSLTKNLMKLYKYKEAAVSFALYSQKFTFCYGLTLLFALKICYVTCRLRHSLVLQPFLKKILDPPLTVLVLRVSILVSCLHQMHCYYKE